MEVTDEWRKLHNDIHNLCSSPDVIKDADTYEVVLNYEFRILEAHLCNWFADLQVSDERKKMCSTTGMLNSVITSELLKYRVSHCVSKRTEAIVKAIINKDFDTFAKITMKDSNQFHAVCLDTFPPNVYMNDTSHAIAKLVHAYNIASDKTKVAYTFDAGPNACLFLLESEVPKVLAVINHIFPAENESVEYLRGIPVEKQAVSEAFLVTMGMWPQEPGRLKYVIHTEVGVGPQVLLEPHDQLLTYDGLPKVLV